MLPFDGLIMDFCAAQNACAVVRGIRNLTDFDYEAQMAAMNRKLRPQVETVFLLPDAPLACISSTLVREISKLGGSVGPDGESVRRGCAGSRFMRNKELDPWLY